MELIGGVRVRVGQRHRIDRAALHAGVGFRRGNGRKHRAEDLHGIAETAAGAHTLSLPAFERLRRLALPHELVLRQEAGLVGHGIPLIHVLDEGRMLHHRDADLGPDLPVAEIEEREREDHPRWVLAGVIEVAEVRHLEGAELDAVEVLAVARERLAVVHLDLELAARAVGELLGDRLHAGCKGALLAPGREVPVDRWAIDSLRSDARA